MIELSDSNGHLRLDLQRRNAYVSGGPVEDFMVPLLRDRIETAIAKNLDEVPNMRLLDVGCGRQPLREHLETRGFQYTGMDVDQNAEGSVEFICAIDKQLPQVVSGAGRYGCIICTEVLEHIADWDMAFKNLSKLAEPDAKILITCPFLYVRHEEPYDFWRPTQHSIKYFAERYNFAVVFNESAGTGWDVLGTVLATLQVSPRTNRFLDRVYASILHRSIRMVFNLLSSRRLQRHTACSSSLYLSNVAVLQFNG